MKLFIGLIVKNGDETKVTKTTRKPGRRVLFEGNSWTNATLGTKIQNRYSRFYDSYVNVLSEALGFECINNGVGASGYSVAVSSSSDSFAELWYQNRMKFMVNQGLTPDIIVIGGAGNDILVRGDDPGRVAEEAQKCINEAKELYKEKGKDMKLIMIGVEKVAGELIGAFTTKSKPMNDALKEVALKNNVPFIDFLTNTTIASDGKTITNGDTPFVLPEYIGDDNLHPTLDGHKKIGLRLAEEVQALLLYENW